MRPDESVRDSKTSPDWLNRSYYVVRRALIRQKSSVRTTVSLLRQNAFKTIHFDSENSHKAVI